jgi:hypothetical protein
MLDAVITKAMTELARRGVKKRHAGKTKAQISAYYSDLRTGKKKARNLTKRVDSEIAA